MRGEAARAVPLNLRPKESALPAKAKSVILLMQNGGPSQMDLFEPKPALARFDGKSHSIKVEMFQQGSEKNVLMKSPFRFHPQGRCGMELSEVLPHIGSVADDLCLVRSMHSEHNNHTEGLIMFMTGKIFQGRPSSRLLDHLCPRDREPEPARLRRAPRPGRLQHHGNLDLGASGWLPALFRGTEIQLGGSPVLNLRPRKVSLSGVQDGTILNS